MGNTLFRPPIDNPLVSGLVSAFLPALRKYAFGDLKIKFDPEDIERLKAKQGERMLLLPNHPGEEDPMILFSLSKQLNERFYYVAAREVFDFWKGLHGYLLQRCGVYSVIRGASDRDSFKTTRNTLKEGIRRLVVFIEGEVSYDNDGLIPLQQGVLQLAFMAQGDLAKEAKNQAKRSGDDATDFPAVHVAPVIIKYLYDSGVEETLEKGIARLEQAVGVTPDAEHRLYERIRAVGQKVIETREEYFDITVSAGSSIDERIAAIKDKSLRKMEGFLGITPEEPLELIPRIRAIRNKMDKMIHQYDEQKNLSSYEERILNSMDTAFSEFYDELDRLVNFLTFKEGYVLERESPERYMELIRRIEKEVFGKRLLLHPRTAVLKVGAITSLKDHYDNFVEDKKSAVDSLCIALETDMLTMLKDARREEPIKVLL